MAADGSSRAVVASRLTLHLGVAVMPYRSRTRKVSSLTTGDVAQFLENKYGIMGAYYRVHEKNVTGALENSLAGALETLVMGGQAIDPWGSACQEIQTGLQKFIHSGESERVGIAGTPTKAALRGVNHRLAHPYARSNPRRPSFIDSSLYVSSIRVWMSSLSK